MNHQTTRGIEGSRGEGRAKQTSQKERRNSDRSKPRLQQERNGCPWDQISCQVHEVGVHERCADIHVRVMTRGLKMHGSAHLHVNGLTALPHSEEQLLFIKKKSCAQTDRLLAKTLACPTSA